MQVMVNFLFIFISEIRAVRLFLQEGDFFFDFRNGAVYSDGFGFDKLVDGLLFTYWRHWK